MKYGLNDKLSLLPMTLYGIQWLVISIPSILILGTVTAQVFGSTLGEQIFYMQKLFAVIGIGLIVQILWGHKLPLVIGPASVLLVGILSATTAGSDVINTSIVIGGISLFILGASDLFGKIQWIFTPRIVAVILALIAFSLAPVILRLIFNYGGDALFNLVFSLILSLSMILLNKMLKGIWRSMVVLIGLVLGVVIYYFFHPLNHGVMRTPGTVPPLSDWITFDFKLDAGVLFSFICCFVALAVNELGSIQSVGKQIQAPELGKRCRRGISVTGIFNSLSGLLGIIGPVDYSLSPGVIAATGCASRFPLIPAGAGLIAIAFSPSLIGIIGKIPEVVMGTILLYLMGSQLSASLQMMAAEKAVSNFNSGLIIGFPLMVAILIAFAPETAIAQIPPVIRPILGNGFAMGTLVVLFMEHVVFRKEK